MAASMDVDPASLVSSGQLMDQHSRNVFTTHSAADQAIESSLFSWVGASRAALVAKAAAWAEATTTLSARLYDHAEGLRVSGVSFAEMDRRDAARLSGPSPSNGGA